MIDEDHFGVEEFDHYFDGDNSDDDSDDDYDSEGMDRDDIVRSMILESWNPQVMRCSGG